MHNAIVAEGGGQRGIYTAGVLDAFLTLRFNPFQLGIGVSAGAQNLLTYFLEQPGYARRAIAELTVAPSFFVPYRWLGARGVIDLDSYFEHTISNEAFRLPYDALPAVGSHRRLVFVATERTSLEPRYLEPDRRRVVDCLKASCAVPFLYRAGVHMDGETLVDGGVSDPLPVRHACERGARRILLIRTSDTPAVESGWIARFDRFRRLRALPPEMQRMLDRHERSIGDTAALLASPPEQIEIEQVVPSRPLASRVFGSRSEALARDYETGLADGRAAARRLARWEDDAPMALPGAPLPAWTGVFRTELASQA